MSKKIEKKKKNMKFVFFINSYNKWTLNNWLHTNYIIQMQTRHFYYRY